MPPYISSKKRNMHKYKTRHSTDLNICKFKFNKMSFQSINSSLAVVWNTLPIEIKKSNTFDILITFFKTKIRKHFLP